jgi:hypothetical protein
MDAREKLIERQVRALERIANVLECAAAQWWNVNPDFDWQGEPVDGSFRAFRATMDEKQP